MSKRGQTPSQTLGPYFAYGLTPEQYGYDFTSIAKPDMMSEDTTGTMIHLVGTVFDGAGKPVSDAMIEIWQSDAKGHYPSRERNNSAFTGFGRSGTNAYGVYEFRTIKPGAANASNAPAINVTVMMRGMLLHTFTRIYFPDETIANAHDQILALVPAERRATLIASIDAPHRYRFDIHMQGDHETVFFDM